MENFNQAENLKLFRQKAGLTQQQLADSINEKQTKIKDIETGKQKISVEFATKVENIHQVNFKWLLTGQGSMYADNSNDIYDNCIALERIGITPSCGTGTVVLDDAEVTPVLLGKKLIENIFKVSDVNNLKVFRASGDSMEDTIYDNDDLLVDIGRKDFNNGGIFVLTINNEWFIKRLQLRINGDLDIISDNKAKYQTETKHPNDDIEIIIQGRVIKNLSRGL